VRAPPRDPRLLVVALGGQALREPAGTAAGAGWLGALPPALAPLGELLGLGYRLVITHGHGPGGPGGELGAPDRATPRRAPLPLAVATAGTQGVIGYAIQQVLAGECRARRLAAAPVALVTRVLVDAEDPAFARPARPVGPFYPAAQARALRRAHGWTLVQAGRRGWRRVVATPRPVRVLEAELVGRLLAGGAVPIACGGGGAPVVETADGYAGVEAVVEKDFASEVLATALGADRLVFLTDVERAAVNFGTPQQLAIERLTAREGRALLGAGEFPPASMGPKIEAGLCFVEAGGREAIVSTPERLRAALEGDAGTRIVP